MTVSSGKRISLFQINLSVISISRVGYGGARITSRFFRSEWPSVDIPLDNEVFAIPKGHNAAQQVRIAQGDYDGKAVIISRVTPDEPGFIKVQNGKSDKKFDFSAVGTVTNHTFYKYKSGYIHHCFVDDLEHGTKYYYKIGDGDSSREFWFQTPPKIDPDAPFTLELLSGGQILLFVGDLSCDDRYKYNPVGIRWDSWGRFIERSAAYQPWIWSAGNHEIEYMPFMGEVLPFKSYLNRIATAYGASKSSNPLSYAVRRASAHIIVLSSYSPLVGDAGNQEGLAERFLDPQPVDSAFRPASYGHSTLEIKNRTHAFYHWNRNDDGKNVLSDSIVFRKQYWASNLRRRRLNKYHLRAGS